MQVNCHGVGGRGLVDKFIRNTSSQRSYYEFHVTCCYKMFEILLVPPLSLEGIKLPWNYWNICLLFVYVRAKNILKNIPCYLARSLLFNAIQPASSAFGHVTGIYREAAPEGQTNLQGDDAKSEKGKREREKPGIQYTRDRRIRRRDATALSSLFYGLLLRTTSWWSCKSRVKFLQNFTRFGCVTATREKGKVRAQKQSCCSK